MIDRRSFVLRLAGCAAARWLPQVVKPKALPTFIDVSSKSGVHFRHQSSRTSQKYLPESMGAGVAMFDYDNDGYQDLFFVNGARLLDPMSSGASPDKSDPRFWDRLYRNNRDGTFTDVTEIAGLRGSSYGMGVATGDFNNDGHTDLLVSNLGGNTLFRNNGDGTFTDVTKKAGVGGSGWCAGACFVDYDRDGFLDLIVTRYLDWGFSKNVYCGLHRPGYRSYCHPDQFGAVSCLVYHNVALESGLAFDQDGKTFAGMGVDFADYDNDGWPDAFVNALSNQRYALFRNSKGSFDDVSDSVGISAITMPHSGWGTKMIDYDNDGWLDIFVAQGHVMDNIELTDPSLRYLEPLLLMKNNTGKFHNVSQESGPAFRVPLSARGAAFGDLDNDGCIDIAINCNDGPAVILHNQGGTGNHWLLINLVGSVSNRDGFGARALVISEQGLEQHRFVSSAGSYLSASDKRVHFGLGPARKVRLLEINWPSGIVQQINSVDADQIITVREPKR